MKKFIGRKLYINWKNGNNNMYVAIEKIPDGAKKLLEMEMAGNSHLMLCNVFEDENGKVVEENLGAPANTCSGYKIDHFFLDKSFWCTPGEANTCIKD